MTFFATAFFLLPGHIPRLIAPQARSGQYPSFQSLPHLFAKQAQVNRCLVPFIDGYFAPSAHYGHWRKDHGQKQPLKASQSRCLCASLAKSKMTRNTRQKNRTKSLVGLRSHSPSRQLRTRHVQQGEPCLFVPIFRPARYFSAR